MNIATWKKEVLEYIQVLNSQLQKNEIAKEWYYGFDVIDGKLIDSPEVLIVGINPGRGNGNRKYEVKFEHNRISYLDCFNDDYRDDYPNTYHLAEKTLKLFSLAGWSQERIVDVLENKAVKTNFFHIATDDVNGINKTLNCLGKHKYRQYFEKSAYFSISLIKLLKPKLVILEGKQVFDNILGECYERYDLWNKYKFASHYDSEIGTHYLAYDRTFSNENREVFIEKLKVLTT